jgi:hypothetical protein
MAFHTVGPESMSEDERVIGRSYKTWIWPLLLLAPPMAVSFLPPHTVAFACAGVALVFLHEIGGRLHDLCIRQRRTNLLLRDQISN